MLDLSFYLKLVCVCVGFFFVFLALKCEHRDCPWAMFTLQKIHTVRLHSTKQIVSSFTLRLPLKCHLLREYRILDRVSHNPWTIFRSHCAQECLAVFYIINFFFVAFVFKRIFLLNTYYIVRGEKYRFSCIDNSILLLFSFCLSSSVFEINNLTVFTI